MARDRDIRNAIKTILDGTGAFDNVYLWSLSDVSDQDACDARACGIEPVGWQESDIYDDAASGLIFRDGSCTISFLARDENPQLRDEDCERLVEVASNALSGQSILGFTAPSWTKFIRESWKPACPPERRIETTFAYRYVVQNFSSSDESE